METSLDRNGRNGNSRIPPNSTSPPLTLFVRSFASTGASLSHSPAHASRQLRSRKSHPAIGRRSPCSSINQPISYRFPAKNRLSFGVLRDMENTLRQSNDMRQSRLRRPQEQNQFRVRRERRHTRKGLLAPADRS